MSSGMTSIGESFSSLPSPSLTTATATRLHRHVHHETTSNSSTLSPSSNQNSSHPPAVITSIPLRLIQFGISTLLRIRSKLPEVLQPWFWVGLWLAMVFTGLIVFIEFHTRIFEILETVATSIKNLGRA